jgi:hypothetical protein
MRLIDNDQFLMTGESVQFFGFLDEPGCRLDNGHHRLVAISRGTKTVPLLVVQGVDEGSRVFMDTGTKRTVGDMLSMERNIVSSRNVAAALRLHFMLAMSREQEILTGGTRGVVSNADLLAWLDKNAGIVDAVSRVHSLRRTTRLNESALAVAWLAFHELDAEAAEDFFEKLRTGENLVEGDPVLALRNWCMNQQGVNRRSLIHYAVIVKAWNDRRMGRPRKIVTWKPFIEPVPKPV